MFPSIEPAISGPASDGTTMSLMTSPFAGRRVRQALLGAVALGALGGAITTYDGFTPNRAFADTAQTQAGPTSFADVVDRVKSSVVSIKVKMSDGGDADSDDQDEGARPQMPQVPPGWPFEHFFHQFGIARRRGRTSPPAPDHGAGLRLLHLRRRLYRHQQSRRRSCDRSQRHHRGRQDAPRQGDRHRPQDRSRAPEGERRQLPVRLVRGESAARRRLGDRGRQSVRPRRHGHGGHRLGSRPRHRLGPL